MEVFVRKLRLSVQAAKETGGGGLLTQSAAYGGGAEGSNRNNIKHNISYHTKIDSTAN